MGPDRVPAEAPLTEREVQALLAQLGRMRGMLYRYYELFLRFIHGAGVVVFVGFVASTWEPMSATALILPFGVIFVGFHSAYLFSYTIFARTYAAAIERRLNAEYGRDILVAHRLEETYLVGAGSRKVVAADIGNPLTMLAADTWHFTVLGAALFVVGTILGSARASELGSPWTDAYLPAVLAWGAVNAAYLGWYFIGRRDERRIIAILDQAYGTTAHDN